MNQHNTHLLTLVKLLEGHLSDAEGLSVREQLASDTLLLQQWKKLSYLYENHLTADELIKTDMIDPELVAAFIEERMSLEQRNRFETSCWNNNAALCEVIVAYQAAHIGSFSADISEDFAQDSVQASTRMLDFVVEQCNPSESAQPISKYLQKIEAPKQSSQQTSLFGSPESEVNREHLKTLPRSKQIEHSARERKSDHHKKYWIYAVLAAAVIAIAFPVYLLLIHNNEETSITENPPLKQSTSLPEYLRPDIKKPLELEDAPQLTKDLENKKEIQISPDSPKTIPKHPVMDKEDNEKPLVAKKSVPEEPETFVNLQITWKRLSGIIGYRTDRESPWKGILSDTSSKEMNLGQSLELHTLPFSWLQGKTAPGLEVVMDANTEIQITVQGIKKDRKKQQSKSDSPAMQVTVDLELYAGKVAFSHLQAGDILQFRNQRQKWEIQVQQDDTSVGFIQKEESSREIMTFSGAIQITSSATQQTISLKPNRMITLNNQGFSSPSKATPKQRWRTKPPRSMKLSKAFVKQLNQSENLLEALLSTPPTEASNSLLISTNLSFSLDPINSVPQAAFSQSEIQRVAAINWLITTAEDQTTRAVWNKIDEDVNTKQSTLPIRTWFKVAQGKVPKYQNLLRELSAGLNARQPLFVRQCSIHFLRQLSRLSLTEYDPNHPSSAAINSVLQKVRRATGNNNRRRP